MWVQDHSNIEAGPMLWLLPEPVRRGIESLEVDTKTGLYYDVKARIGGHLLKFNFQLEDYKYTNLALIRTRDSIPEQGALLVRTTPLQSLLFDCQPK